MADTIRVQGLRELNRAFARADRTVRNDKNKKLREAAEPVRRGAEVLAEGRITNIGEVWPRMRVGVTQSSVYVAPRTRNRGGPKRPRFGTRLVEDAMIPSLNSNREQAVRRLDELLAEMERDWARG